MSDDSTTENSNFRSELLDAASGMDHEPQQFSSTRVEAAGRVDPDDTVTDRQERLRGFEQSELSSSTVLLIGAGGLGSEIGEGLARKGVGRLVICDGDIVERSNLSRQRFFSEDIGGNKAVALARNLSDESSLDATFVGHPHHFGDALATTLDVDPDIVICALDSDEGRREVTNHYYEDCPVIVTGLGYEAVGGYVFVQEPSGPCFRCFRPNASGGGSCGPDPAVKDPGKVVGGYTLYSIDSVLMDRYRDWDLMEFFLSGDVPAGGKRLEQRCDRCSAE